MPHKFIHESVIVSACRTPIGALNGSLSTCTAPELASIVIREALQRASLSPEQVDEVILGEVLTAGVGQAPARQAARYAGIPDAVPCLTINKMCGSGLKAVMLAEQAVRSGDAEIVVAGGMESMSKAPYLIEKARTGYRLGDGILIDSLIKDGLWDVYNQFHMGNAAELCARKYRVSRAEQDAYAILSFKRALDAQRNHFFEEEIVPVVLHDKKGEKVISADEGPDKVDFQKLPALPPVFEKEGTITAANASQLSDGAAVCVVMSLQKAVKSGLTPLAKIITHASTAKAPEWFTTAPIDCIQKLTGKSQLTLSEIDLFEVNEAFAVVNLALEKQLGIPRDQMNAHGGAIALGHPIGASGARILVTLLYALKRYGKKRGLATACIGGGEASGIIVERMR